MAAETHHGKILVLDDHYGIASEDFYSRTEFEREYGGLPFTFVFSSAWDQAAGRYTVEEALHAVETHKPDGVLLDIMFDQRGPAGQLGLTILRELTARFPALPVVMMTVLTRDEAWAECARLGAVDYLPKPLDARLLWQTLDRYVGVGLEPEHWLLGQSPGFLDALISAAQASEGGRTAVLITGDTGTGKELLARYVGRHGARAGGPFVPIHVAPVSFELQQAELFGAKKGAYTGANQDRKGYFEAADKGVAFLDEIGNIDMRAQANLLRVTESGEITPLGAAPRRVDVQIVSATNDNLGKKVKDGEFRQDLWQRLRGAAVHLPRLADRRDDIPLLMRHLLRVEVLARRKTMPTLPMPALPASVDASLMAFPWPGNVRELRNYAMRVIDRAGDSRPDERIFLEALQDMREETKLVTCAETFHETEKPHDEAIDSRRQPATGVQEEIQRLRLMELALLYGILERTRDQVSRIPNRAKAAAILKGAAKCNTNVFDRRVQSLWSELTDESRELAARRFPELAPALKTPAASE